LLAALTGVDYLTLTNIVVVKLDLVDILFVISGLALFMA
jgi:hypothetical protein